MQKIKQLFWRFRSHSHGTDNMKLIDQMPETFGGYLIYECQKCGLKEAI